MNIQKQFDRRMERSLTDAKRQWNMQADKLSLLHPAKQIARKKELLIQDAKRLQNQMSRARERAVHRLALYGQRLDGASPSKKFTFGYAYPVDMDGHNIRSVTDVKAGDRMLTYVTDGRIWSTVTQTAAGEIE